MMWELKDNAFRIESEVYILWQWERQNNRDEDLITTTETERNRTRQARVKRHYMVTSLVFSFTAWSIDLFWNNCFRLFLVLEIM